MPAPAGNNHNPHGRPRRLDTEISRLTEAAQHAGALLDQRYLLVVLMGGGDPECACQRREIEAASAHLGQIERHLAALQRLAEPIEDAVPRRKRRHPNGVPVLHADHFTSVVATAAVALDRLLGPEATAQ